MREGDHSRTFGNMAFRSFKSDDSFLEKLAIGAAGTKRVIEDLVRLNQDPVELERGSTGYKIWKSIKIKRIRVPDVLCVRTGIRVECRAKQKLAISMSHSTSDSARGWDAGLNDNDYIAMVVRKKSGQSAISWIAEPLVQYVKVADLRAAYAKGRVTSERPKGSQEGFESRLTWPAAVASAAGTIVGVTTDRIQYKRKPDSRTITLNLSKKGTLLAPLVAAGARTEKDEILASVVPVYRSLPIRVVPRGHYEALIHSSSLTDRFTAVKAMSHMKSDVAETRLRDRLHDENEHVYVRMEAAASLVRLGITDGLQFIRAILQSEYSEHRLEAVIILGELPGADSERVLLGVLRDLSQRAEIRAGVAWALGELGRKKSIPALVAAFEASELSIREEAARSLRKICDRYHETVLGSFRDASDTTRPGVAWALARAGTTTPSDLLEGWAPANLDRRQWSAWILGQSAADRFVMEIESLRRVDSEVYFAATVLWKILASWVHDLKEY